MAFWGIEVRPGKPYTHRYDDTRGRLRVCQATLGNGKGATKSVLQCNVGNKSPILICSLIPNSSETCHLELEFEEEDEVYVKSAYFLHSPASCLKWKARSQAILTDLKNFGADILCIQGSWISKS